MLIVEDDSTSRLLLSRDGECHVAINGKRGGGCGPRQNLGAYFLATMNLKMFGGI
jgi:hypothetical protein